jgi:hypothetical protein
MKYRLYLVVPNSDKSIDAIKQASAGKLEEVVPKSFTAWLALKP